MIYLGYICALIILLDALSTPFKYMHDRVPRPAWKKNYALRFAVTSVLIDMILAAYVILSIKINI